MHKVYVKAERLGSRELLWATFKMDYDARSFAGDIEKRHPTWKTRIKYAW